ncbi:hypothetical protein HYY73_06540 [Candidatus Woesearchaeota archaeon]|nr:hypothetical protein [Candidatus Woesearchaeota archaeon]
MVNASKILPVVLVALILVSAVQAFQLNALKEKISEGKISVSTNSGSKSQVSSGSAVASSGSGGAARSASSIQDLPTMVGGC